MNLKILLDTNVLIGAFSKQATERESLKKLIYERHQFITSAFCWHEFVTGPIMELHKLYALSIVEERIVPVNRDIAELGAKLFNETGRRKGSRADCLIAATAIREESQLFTHNRSDFTPLEPFGLRLVA